MRTFSAIFALLAIMASFRADAQEAMSAAEKRAIESVVRDYLLKKPEVIIEALDALKTKQATQKRTRAKKAVADHRAEIFSDPASPVGGNPTGDVTLVEFFDYRCGVCRRVHPIVAQLLRDDKNIRRVYKEWPILGPESVHIARAALAAREQGKYLEFHDALYEHRGRVEAKTLAVVAKKIGINFERLKRDMRSPDVSAALKRNYALAQRLELTGTPSFVLGDQVIGGGSDLDTMKALIAEARAKK